MRTSTLCLGVLLAAAPTAVSGAAPLDAPARPPGLELTRAGRARAVVAVPAGAPPEVRRAAEELVTFPAGRALRPGQDLRRQ